MSEVIHIFKKFMTPPPLRLVAGPKKGNAGVWRAASGVNDLLTFCFKSFFFLIFPSGYSNIGSVGVYLRVKPQVNSAIGS